MSREFIWSKSDSRGLTGWTVTRLAVWVSAGLPGWMGDGGGKTNSLCQQEPLSKEAEIAVE